MDEQLSQVALFQVGNPDAWEPPRAQQIQNVLGIAQVGLLIAYFASECREAAGRNYTMGTGMMFQFLIPTMEHAEEADSAAGMAGIARHLDQRFGTGAEQEIVDDLLVLQG